MLCVKTHLLYYEKYQVNLEQMKVQRETYSMLPDSWINHNNANGYNQGKIIPYNIEYFHIL